MLRRDDSTEHAGEASERSNLEWALMYARQGWRVFPLHTPTNTIGGCTCGYAEKCPTGAGKHPRIGRWQELATSEERQIRAWWRQWPDANIGGVTGQASGFVVLDADDGPLGEREVRGVSGGVGVDGPHVRTANGRHRYYAWPGERVANKVKKQHGWAFEHCDFRGDGGYVVLPPSLHKSGVRYAWAEGATMTEGGLPEMPGWLLDGLRAEEGGGTHGTGGGAQHVWVPENEMDGEEAHTIGQWALEKYKDAVLVERKTRNEMGKELALQLRDGRLSQEAAWAYMRDYQEAVRDAGDPSDPYTEIEAKRTLRSIYSRPPRDPALRDRNRAEEDGLPAVEVADRPLREMADTSRDALVGHQRGKQTDHERLYTRDGLLVRTFRCDDEENGDEAVTHVEEVPPAALALELSRSANFIATTFTKKGERKQHHAIPPNALVQALAKARDWPLPELRVVTETPILRADGTLLAEPGYDPATRALYWPHAGLVLPHVPMEPSEGQAAEALEVMRLPFAQFPFADEASWANALALLITLLMRRAIKGLVPMAGIDAPNMSSGKTLLSQANIMYATGRVVPTPAVPNTEEEWGKQIITWLRNAREVVLLDNVEVALHSPALESVLTSGVASRRGMATLEDVVYRNEAVWIVNGNNLVLRGALVRRVYTIRIDARVERPWGRKSRDFAVPNLLAWIAEQRGELLAAAYTVLRRWFALGMPSAPHGRELASYEEWSRVVGGVLACVGVDAFLEGADEQMEFADPSRSEWAEFLGALCDAYQGGAFRAAEVYGKHIADADLFAERDRAVLEAVPTELQPYIDKKGNFSQRLGKALLRRKDTLVGGVRVTLLRQDAAHGHLFKLTREGVE